jgi:transposase
VELFESIRRQHRDEGLSIRELAGRHHVHRRTVRQALISAVPPQRKAPERAAPALGAHEAMVRAWLEADLEVPRKQRHTARRVWQRLCEEVDAEVAESTVRALVGRIRAELGLDAAACGVTIPQDHRPGEEAECDFGEFYAWIAGAQLRLYLFVMRLSFSGRGFVVAFANQAQEAFLEGHVLAFEHFGGVPAGQIRYDNLKDAVRRILVGRDRVETERFIALRSHYGFDSFFCEPGIKGAHEKGGVEGEVGRFRRNWLVPVPVVASLAELNGLLVGRMAADDARHVGRRAQTVAEAFALEQGVLHPLPDEPFDSARLLGAKADAKARVCVWGRGIRCRPGWRGAGSRSALAPASSRSSTVARSSRSTPAASTRAPRTWCWTTTWRSWSASPARWPARPRSPKPAPAASSLPATRGFGTRLAAPVATGPAPAR